MAKKSNTDSFEVLRAAVIADAGRPGFLDRVVSLYLPALAQLVRYEETAGSPFAPLLADALMGIQMGAAQAQQGESRALRKIVGSLPKAWRHFYPSLTDVSRTAHALRDSVAGDLQSLERNDPEMSATVRELARTSGTLFADPKWHMFDETSWRSMSNPDDRALLIAALFEGSRQVLTEERPPSLASNPTPRTLRHAPLFRPVGVSGRDFIVTWREAILDVWNAYTQKDGYPADWWRLPARVRATMITMRCLRAAGVPFQLDDARKAYERQVRSDPKN